VADELDGPVQEQSAGLAVASAAEVGPEVLRVGVLNQAPLTVTADSNPTTTAVDPFTKVYAQPNPAFTVRYAGLVNGDTPGSLGGKLTFTTLATQASDVGSYAVTPGGLTSGNYAITYGKGTLNIMPAPLSATGVNFSATAGGPFSGAVATFVNADPYGNASSYTAVINWGDGTTSTGVIAGDGHTHRHRVAHLRRPGQRDGQRDDPPQPRGHDDRDDHRHRHRD
jgi:hypothetical protein